MYFSPNLSQKDAKSHVFLPVHRRRLSLSSLALTIVALIYVQFQIGFAFSEGEDDFEWRPLPGPPAVSYASSASFR